MFHETFLLLKLLQVDVKFMTAENGDALTPLLSNDANLCGQPVLHTFWIECSVRETFSLLSPWSALNQRVIYSLIEPLNIGPRRLQVARPRRDLPVAVGAAPRQQQRRRRRLPRLGRRHRGERRREVQGQQAAPADVRAGQAQGGRGGQRTREVSVTFR